MIPRFLMDSKRLFILLNTFIYKLQHFFEKNPTLFVLRVGTPEANAPMRPQISGIHGIFLTEWRILDAFLIKGKYSKMGIAATPKMTYKKYGRA